jgi:hypothetical protein
MKNSIKFCLYVSYSLAAISLICFSGCRCSPSNTSKPTPDPLAGWTMVFGYVDTAAEVSDYENYIENLPPKGKKTTSMGYAYKNDGGQHALVIEVFVGGTESWSYIFIFDKDDKRINVIKYKHTKYQS